jgi:hypothetical protein
MERTHDKSDLLDFNILVLGSNNWPLTVSPNGFTIPSDVLRFNEQLTRRLVAQDVRALPAVLYLQALGPQAAVLVPCLQGRA